MNINFNNVRKQALYAYESLCEQLNESINKERQFAKVPTHTHGQEVDITDYVLIDVEDIEDTMNDLRNTISAIAMTFIEGSEDFYDVFSELYDDNSEGLAVFNPEE